MLVSGCDRMRSVIVVQIKKTAQLFNLNSEWIWNWNRVGEIDRCRYCVRNLKVKFIIFKITFQPFRTFLNLSD